GGADQPYLAAADRAGTRHCPRHRRGAEPVLQGPGTDPAAFEPGNRQAKAFADRAHRSAGIENAAGPGPAAAAAAADSGQFRAAPPGAPRLGPLCPAPPDPRGRQWPAVLHAGGTAVPPSFQQGNPASHQQCLRQGVVVRLRPRLRRGELLGCSPRDQGDLQPRLIAALPSSPRADRRHPIPRSAPRRMSLINDALKKAQKQQTQQPAPSASASPLSPRPASRPGVVMSFERMLLVVVTLVAVIVGATAVGVLLLRRDDRLVVASSARPAAPAPAVAAAGAPANPVAPAPAPAATSSPVPTSADSPAVVVRPAASTPATGAEPAPAPLVAVSRARPP